MKILIRKSSFSRVLLYLPSFLIKYSLTTNVPIREIKETNVMINTNSNNPHQLPNILFTNLFIAKMKSYNKSELLLSLIDTSERDIRDGMKKSCDSISSNLFKHIQHMVNNKNDIDTFERINVNVVAKAKEVKPEGWDYAQTACYSMKIHMKFLSTAIEDILNEIRLIMVDYINSLSRITETLAFEDTKVFENRPHSLAGVRPPDPKSVADAAILKGADIIFLKKAMRSIQLENDNFERENTINKRLIKFDDKAMMSVVYAPEEEKEEDSNTQLTPPVTRNVDDRAAWRPPIPEGTIYPWWWYDFSNVWGDKGLPIKALTDFD